MLKRLIKRRLVLAVVAAIFLAGMLGAPIRREYSIDNHPCAQTDCSGQALITDSHYGIPFAWLTLSKSVQQPTQEVAASSITHDKSKLMIDVLTWGFVTAFIVLSIKSPDTLRFHANSRN